MICFSIPKKSLRLFLIALDANFNLPDPDYIFLTGEYYDVVIKRPAPAMVEAIDDFIARHQISLGEEIKKEAFLVSAARDILAALQTELKDAAVNSFPQISYCRQNLDLALRAYK